MKLTTTTFVSVDGVMQGIGAPDEDRRGGFDRGGWTTPLWDTEAGTFLNQVYGRADAFLFGRRQGPGQSARVGRIAGHPQRGNDPGLPAHRALASRNVHGRLEAREEIDISSRADDCSDRPCPVGPLAVPPSRLSDRSSNGTDTLNRHTL